ncbi:DEAD/DEAH box helicase family protein [Shewanella sp. 202IG2-18]|uniref:LPD38 domain-containing protein n=1 Tax=Parashewanella hymeniacidonis TaxID=2807618 RepID=UPI00195FE9E6|nr:LPD38 domain-containing protein [Parashewanella hymeniacidonis]MBM7070865.1 DEAD/DEAH box helicase family protein [Parashewanella hymeniacidonis]
MSNKFYDPFAEKEIEFNDPFAQPKAESGVVAAFGAGVDQLQEIGYRAVKGFTDTGENTEGYEEGSFSRSVAETIGQGGTLSQWADEGIKRNQEEQKAYKPTVESYKDIDSLGDLGSYTGELVSNSLPYMAGAATGAGAFVMGGGLSEEAYSSQPEDEKNVTRAVTSGFGQMALERIGLKGSTGQIYDAVKKEGLRNTAKRIRKGEFAEVYKRPDSALEFGRRVLFGAAIEGATETGQEALAQWGAGKDLSEINHLDEAFVGGFVVGGTIRAGSESAQLAMDWQKKAQPVAKTGIESLVESGVPMDEAIEQVRQQLIDSAIKQGMTEVQAEAVASRTLKLEYDIDHEVFTPVADDVASRRAAMNERLHQQRVEGGFGQVQESLAGDNASSVDDLLSEAKDFNDPFASELEQQQAFEQDQNIKGYQQQIADEVNSQPLAIEDKGVIFANDNSQEQLTTDDEAASATPANLDTGSVIEEGDQQSGSAPSSDILPQTGIDEQGNADTSGVESDSGETASVSSGNDLHHSSLDESPPNQEVKPEQQAASQEAVSVSGDQQVKPKTVDEATLQSEYDFSYEGLSSVGQKNAREAVARIKNLDKEQNSEAKQRKVESIKIAINKARVPEDIKSKLSKLLDVASSDSSANIDQQAHEAATSPLNDLPEPTQAQKEANNYKLGRVKHSGFDIGIENPQGSDRKGVDSDGKEWSVKMNHHYGDITGTKGADGDALDVFVKPSTDNSNKVFVVNQVDSKSRKFDEHKIMLGFETKAEAEKAYLSNYSKGWKGTGSIAEMSLDDFKAWAKDGDTTKPVELKAESKPDLYADGVERVTHTTKKGKELTGIIDNNLTRNEAKAIDPFSFRKGKDGWFIREERINEHNDKLLKGAEVKAEKERGITVDAKQEKPNIENKPTSRHKPVAKNSDGEIEEKRSASNQPSFDDVKDTHIALAGKTATGHFMATHIRKLSSEIQTNMMLGDDFDTAWQKENGKFDPIIEVAYRDFLGRVIDAKAKAVENSATKADTETKQVTESKQDETIASDNQTERTGQQPDLSSNEQGRVGSRDSGVGKDDSEGNGSAATSGRGKERSTKPSTKNHSGTSSLNLDDVDNIANGTESERVATNLEAIRLLKQIQAEDRPATLEEKKILARYVGWGGLKDVFNSQTRKKFAKEAHAELKKLLTRSEYEGVRESIQTAFYTSKDIVKAMWSGVEAFGLGTKPMNVVEPSVGSGNFIGWQPEHLRKQSHWSATEIDPITGNLAKLIYDESDIQVKGYQDAKFKQGVFSLAIGNPPFGAFTVTDSTFKDISGLSIHNYMIAKTSKLLHENGLMMMVITSRFLDTKNANHSELSKTMDFVGAIRLPNTAFKSNAGTEVTTDVVIFRKLKEGEKATNTVWNDTQGQVNGVRINKWFEQNPQYVLGEVSNQGTMYASRAEGGELTVNPTAEHADIGKSLSNAIAKLADNVDLTVSNETLDKVGGEVTLTESDLSIGGMVLNGDDNVVLREDDDIEGNAVLTKVTPDTVWTENGKHLEAIKTFDKDKQRIAAYAKTHLLNAAGKLKSSYKTNAFKAIEGYLNGTVPFGKFRGELLKALGNAQLGPNKFKRLKAILKIRNTALALLKAEKQNLSNVEALRTQLNKDYDALASMGTKSKPESIEKNLGLLNGNLDIESGLDSVSKSSKKVTKHAIFDKRMIQPYVKPESADNVDDAVNFSMKEKGVVDVAYIADLMGKSKIEAKKLLTEGDKPYLLQDPESGNYVFVDDYLSGNVKAKLAAAENAGLDKNAELLKTALPKDKTTEQVKPSIRATWMDEGVFESFLSALGVNANVSVDRSIGSIKILKHSAADKTTLANQFNNGIGLSVSKLFEHAATGKALVIYDRIDAKTSVKNDKKTSQANVLVNKLADLFTTWSNSNPDIKKQITDNFNDRVNTHTVRKFNGRLYLQTVGMNPEIDMRKTQLDGALRMIQTPNALLDHTVGAGKTFTAITGVMERRRLGMSKKPLVVVPNHIIGSFTADFYKLYPGARVLAASDKQMDAKNRKKFFSQMATGDYDAIIIGHSHLKKLPNDFESTEMVFNEKIDELREALEKAKKEKQEAGGRGASVSQMEKSITGLKDKLKAKKEALEKEKDSIGFSFSDLGIDYMVMDEAHEFKNLMYATRGDRVVGMNDPKGSDKALDLLIKARGVQGLENGGVTFMTGTPVSNSLVEIYTMMYYLGHDMLKENHISHYDAFSGSFIDTQVALEYTPTGTVKERRILKGLNSAKELIAKYKQFADVITQADMVNIYAQDVGERNEREGTNETTRFPIPNVANGGRQLVTTKASETQKEFNDYLIARMEGIESISGREARKEYAKIDNPLWVLSDARKASLDVRLVDPSLQADPTGKVKSAAKSIKENYDKWTKEKGTQLVFSDMGVPTKTAAGNAKADLVKLAALVMDDKKARSFVTTSLKSQENAYTSTLVELVEMVRSNHDLDADKAEKAEDMIRDLEAATLTADTGFSVYDDLKQTLIESGIPENEIAFIHDYNTPSKKDALFDAVNEGDIRVLIGSSSKMGAGTNVQKRLVALHHMDAPWRPSDMEQREGRIIRQGNSFYEQAAAKGKPESFEVVINAYSTEGSSDPVMWQILERKAAAIEQFRNGDIDEFVEDQNSDADSYANFKAQTTGNPIYKMKLGSDGELLGLETDFTSKSMEYDAANKTVRNYDKNKAKLSGFINMVSKIKFDHFDMAGFKKVLADAVEQQSNDAEAYQIEDAAWEMLSDARKKKVKKPVRPKLKDIYAHNHSYSKALNNELIAPLSQALKDTDLRLGESIEQELKLDDNVVIGISVETASIGEKDKTYNSEVYLKLGKANISLTESRNVKDFKTPKVVSALHPAVTEKTIKEYLDAAKSNLSSLESDYKNAQPALKNAPSDKALTSEKDKNLWLEVETEIADIKDKIRRSEKPNRFIDKEEIRNVKAAANDVSIKPETVTFNGESFETLGLDIQTTKGKVKPAYDKDGNYVHLVGQNILGEDSEFIIEGVKKKPDSIPAQDYAFLDKLKPQPEQDIEQVALKSSIPSIVKAKNKTKPKGISVAEGEKIVKEFLDNYNGNIKLDYVVKETQEEIYGPEYTIEKEGRIKGSFNRERGVFAIATANLSDRADARETLRHEILGHYGLTLFGENVKKDILQKIIDSKNEPSLKKLWLLIEHNKHYKKLSKELQAEEVFAHVVEAKRNKAQRIYDVITSWLRHALKKIGLSKYPVSTSELHRLGETIAKNIRNGKVGNNNPPPKGGFKPSTDMFSRSDDSIVLADEKLVDAGIRKIQDKFRRLKVLQGKLSITESNNTYQAEEAFHGKVTEDLREMEVNHVDKITESMAKHKLTQEEVDLYLIAKHAEERNAYIDTINPELQGKGSGMSNEDAQAILDKAVFEGKRLQLEEVANHVYAMLTETRQRMVDSGLEAQDAIDSWQEQYQYYVPLKGYAVDDAKSQEGKRFGTGKGFNVKGRETIKALGRRSLAESPLLHTISDTSRAIIRARKNEVGNTFIKMVKDNPDSDFWQVFTEEQPDMKRGTRKVNGQTQVEQVPMSGFEMAKDVDNYFTTKIDGVERYIKVKDPLILKAMNNLGVEQTNVITQTLGKVTRTLSALVTTWNPEFMLTNFSRDIQTAIYNVLAETQIADGKAKGTEKLAKKMIKSVPKAMVTLRKAFRENSFEGEWGSYLKEFLEHGAKTGWVNQKDINELGKQLNGAIAAASDTATGKARKHFNTVIDFVSDYNDIVENATRFSTYYHARKQGVSAKQAASLAKNLTVNFNRKGEWGNTVNSLYMFANASVQGTANMLRAIATPKDVTKSRLNPARYNLSQKIAFGTVMATIAASHLMRMIGGDDEDGEPYYDKIPDYVKANNFVIMLGEGKDYVAIPMPYGYNIFANIGHALDDLQRGKSVGKVASRLMLTATSVFSPIGSSDSQNIETGLLKTAMPTVGKPIVELVANENFFGSNIYPEQSGYKVKKSDGHLGDNRTWQWLSDMTTWLNDNTGGSKYREGGISIAPQSIQHMLKFIGGGLFQFASRTTSSTAKVASGEEVDRRDIPFSRRFYKAVDPRTNISNFYDDKSLLDAYKMEYKTLPASERSAYKQKYDRQLKLHAYGHVLEKQLRNLNQMKRKIEGSKMDEAKKEKLIEKIDNKKIELSLQFSQKKKQLGIKDL